MTIENRASRQGVVRAIAASNYHLNNLLKPFARTEIACDGVFSPPIDASPRIA
ncbi:hypothetical protein [Methylobacterium sp. D54C]